MLEKRILYLPIKTVFFNKIMEGRKEYEYRKVKEYWNKRLLNEDGTPREYDEIQLRVGYKSDKPVMRVKWKGWKLAKNKYDEQFYALDVSEILYVKNVKKDNPNIKLKKYLIDATFKDIEVEVALCQTEACLGCQKIMFEKIKNKIINMEHEDFDFDLDCREK